MAASYYCLYQRLFWLVGSAFGQNQIPSSRSPGLDRNGLDSQVGGDKRLQNMPEERLVRGKTKAGTPFMISIMT